jgi:hypothetical protein
VSVAREPREQRRVDQEAERRPLPSQFSPLRLKAAVNARRWALSRSGTAAAMVMTAISPRDSDSRNSVIASPVASSAGDVRVQARKVRSFASVNLEPASSPVA